MCVCNLLISFFSTDKVSDFIIIAHSGLVICQKRPQATEDRLIKFQQSFFVLVPLSRCPRTPHCTVGHKSHDPCRNNMEAGVWTFGVIISI